MHLIAVTDEKGLHVDREQLERAGIRPGRRALVEIRPYTEEDWVADGERTFSTGEEFLAYLGACPSHVVEDEPVPTYDATEVVPASVREAKRSDRGGAW